MKVRIFVSEGGVTLLSNLEKARKDKGISLVDIADVLDVRSQTVRDKINGKYAFKFSEALKLQKTFFPEYEITYLFTPDKYQSEEVTQ